MHIYPKFEIREGESQEAISKVNIIAQIKLKFKKKIDEKRQLIKKLEEDSSASKSPQITCFSHLENI